MDNFVLFFTLLSISLMESNFEQAFTLNKNELENDKFVPDLIYSIYFKLLIRAANEVK